MISPIQLIRMTQYANLYAGMDDGHDKYLIIAGFDGTTGTTPTFVDVFSKGCMLFHITDSDWYRNTAASGLTPVWVLSGGGGGGTPVYGEVPAGAVDGVNNIFTLTQNPNPLLSLQFYVDGVLQNQGPGNDYTILGNTISTTNAPLVGSVLLAYYVY